MRQPSSLPVKWSRVVLLGFMGAGKTTTGALLAARLGWDFLDADRAVEEAEGRSIAEIFEQEGEARFRALESATIARLLEREQAVVALGGGAIESESVRKMLQDDPRTGIVYLEAALETLLDRCAGTGAIRPVLRDRQRLAERWQKRLPHYRAAHLTVNTEGLDADSSVELIVKQLDGRIAPAGEPDAALSTHPGRRPS